MCCRSGNDVHFTLYKQYFRCICRSSLPIGHKFETPNLHPRNKMFAFLTFFPFLFATPILELGFVIEAAPRNIVGFIFRLIALRVYGSKIICGSDAVDVLLYILLTSPPPRKYYPCLFRSPCHVGHLLTTWSVCPRTQRGRFLFNLWSLHNDVPLFAVLC